MTVKHDLQLTCTYKQTENGYGWTHSEDLEVLTRRLRSPSLSSLSWERRSLLPAPVARTMPRGASLERKRLCEVDFQAFAMQKPTSASRFLSISLLRTCRRHDHLLQRFGRIAFALQRGMSGDPHHAHAAELTKASQHLTTMGSWVI